MASALSDPTYRITFGEDAPECLSARDSHGELLGAAVWRKATDNWEVYGLNGLVAVCSRSNDAAEVLKRLVAVEERA